MSHKTDPDLLRAWRTTRDEEAFRLLVARHGALVQGVARRRLDEPDLAADIVGRAFALLAQRPDRAPADRLAGWLAGVAVHLSETENRAGRRRQARERRAAEEGPRPETPMSPHAQDLAHRLDESVMRLDPKDRECLLLHIGEGLTYEEVAGRLGLTGDAARMRTHRALDRLRRRLGLGAGALVPGLDGWRAVPLSTSETDRLVRAALAPSAKVGAGTAALGWLLMTTTQKIGVGLAASFLLLLLGGGAARLAQAPPAAVAAAKPDVRTFVDEWRGALTYVVRRTGRRVSQNVASTIDPAADGLRFRIRYDTPGWGVDARWSFSPGTMTKVDKGQTETFRLTSAAPDRLVGERHVDEPGRPYDQRVTLVRTGNEIGYLVEERLEGRDWAFATEYRMVSTR